MIAPSTKQCFLLSRTRTIHATSSTSYPDVSLSTKMCVQRKAGRRQRARRRFACRLYPPHGPLRFITSRSPLPCEKRSAWGGGCHELFSLRSKRFRLVSEQRNTEERDFRFWPREKLLAPLFSRSLTSLTLVPRSFRLNRTETLATQATSCFFFLFTFFSSVTLTRKPLDPHFY